MEGGIWFFSKIISIIQLFAKKRQQLFPIQAPSQDDNQTLPSQSRLGNPSIETLIILEQVPSGFDLFIFLKNMYVGSTLLSGVDRLSIRSVLTGATGSILGVIGSAIFIILCFIFFIGPVIMYFQGDYIASTFATSSVVSYQEYTGCDFKMAISFHDKTTGDAINHQRLLELLDVTVIYSSPTGSSFSADVESCNSEYFSEMDEPLQSFSTNDCFIVPDKLGFPTETASGYISSFGFQLFPKCPNPFVCIYNSQQTAGNIAEMLDIFKNSYYIMYFTSDQLNQKGYLERKWYNVYSTEWEGHETIIPYIYVLFENEQVHLDNSIMPWFNNQSYTHRVWMGSSFGFEQNQDTVEANGLFSVLSTEAKKYITTRQYKKLDWLLGLLGGGFFLLYFLFWLVFNSINTTKQKIQNCKALMLSYEVGPPDRESLLTPKISYLYYLIDWLPFSVPFLKKEQHLIAQSEKMIDVVDLIKKQRIAMRNLRYNEKFCKFEPKKLEENQISKIQQLRTTEYDEKFELQKSVLTFIEDEASVPRVYDTNYSMLMINNTEEAHRKLTKLQPIENTSRRRIPNLKEEQKGCLHKIGGFITKFLLFFDIFGAKPNLVASPKNSSICGCICTFIIIILAILTFVLTLGNMSKTRTHMDSIYQPPEQMKVELTAGVNFKFAVCFSSSAFNDGLIVSEERVADLKLYQYTREGTKESIQYHEALWIRDDPTIYFDFNSQQYAGLPMKYCFRPYDETKFRVSGSDKTHMQEYFGVEIKPYCSGSPSFCVTNKAAIDQAFYDLLNLKRMYLAMPENKYFPLENRVYSNPSFVPLSEGTYVTVLNYTNPIEETIYMESLQIVDDQESWIIGQQPLPMYETLSSPHAGPDITTESVESVNPYYKLKIQANGVVSRVLLTNYKVDFLFATIGGCLMFFFLFFGCLGRWYNQYSLKARLGQILYEEESYVSFSTWICRYLNIPFCNDEVMKKVESDLDAISTVQRVDNIYHLSTAGFRSLQEKNLALVYLKQRIKEDEEIVIKKDESDDEEQDEEQIFDDFYDDWDASRQKNNLLQKDYEKNKVVNVSNHMMSDDIQNEKQINRREQQLTRQPLTQNFQPNRKHGKINKATGYFDLFKNNSELTLDGKRSVKSKCGGICCILQFILIILLIKHFLTVYFSNLHFISSERRMMQDLSDNKIEMETGKNFKFMLSFFKNDDYNFQNVSDIVKDVGIEIQQVTVVRQNNDLKESVVSTPLVPCSSGYLRGFLNQFEDGTYYDNIKNAYCVPDGVKLVVSGSPSSEKKQYFKLRIFNKYGSLSAAGIAKVKQLLENYLPLYHISDPLKDYNKRTIHYDTKAIKKSISYQYAASRTYNITLVSTKVRYDTAVNPSNELPSLDTYEIIPYQYQEYYGVGLNETDRFCQLRFQVENFVNVHTVKKVKVDELFGLVGGAILFIFFGLGCFPRSFNEYRMRYIIGSRLYTILGKKKRTKVKKVKGKIINKDVGGDTDQSTNLSELRILQAWIISFWASFSENYESNRNLKLVSLIESRVSLDLSIYEFYKNLQACQISISRMELTANDQIDLTKVYAKKIDQFKTQKLEKSFFQEMDDQLKEAAKMNKLSEWDLKVIVSAKNRSNKVGDVNMMIFEKWLDKYFGLDRSTSRAPSTYSRQTYGYKGSTTVLKAKPKDEYAEDSRKGDFDSESSVKNSKMKKQIMEEQDLEVEGVDSKFDVE